MSEVSRIRGMSIGLTMDDSQIRRTVSSIKDSFREVRATAQTQFNNIKFDTKNVDTYKKHVDDLTDTYKQQEKNVNDLKARYDELEAQGKGNTQEAMRLRTEYQKQADVLNRLSDQIKYAEDRYYDLRVESSKFTKASEGFSKFGKSLGGISDGLVSVGKGLTTKITAPAVGAATAVGGMVAAFGWGRLTGMDAAQSQLKGLGYEAKDVERIMGQVKTSVQGTTMTMAEGTSVAAGALAAGVDEGEELEQYIRRVGNAAVGANRDVGDMAMIFNRVQGTGKLMTQELNMIEDGMPGFSMAMAEHLGVTQEEFRKMVTAGEVSSQDFMGVMDDFAGDMAEANANSWAGLVSNAKAWIGILGETLLGGVFEQSKEAVADFIEVMKSDELAAWAEDVAVVIGQKFTEILEAVKGMIQWFTGLDDSTKNMILKFAGLAVAAGPVLLVLGKLGKGISGAAMGISKVLKPMGKFSVALADGGLQGDRMAKVFPAISKGTGLLKGGFAALTGPIGLTIGAIALLGAGFVIAYKKSETFRNFIDGIGEKLKGVWEGFVQLKDNISMAFEAITNIFSGSPMAVSQGRAMLVALGIDPETVDKIIDAILNIREHFDNFKETIGNILNGIKDFFVNAFDAIKNWWSDNEKGIVGGVVGSFNWMKDAISAVMELIAAIWDRAWSIIKGTFDLIWPVIQRAVEVGMTVIQTVIQTGMSIIQKIFEVVGPAISLAWDVLWTTVKAVVGAAWDIIKSVVQVGASLIQGIIKTVTHIINGDWSAAWEQIKNTTSTIKDIVVNLITNLKDRSVELIKDLVTRVVQFFVDMYTQTKKQMQDMLKTVTDLFTNIKDGAIQRVKDLRDDVKQKFIDVYNNTKKALTDAKNSAITLATEMKDKVIAQAKDIWDYFKKLPGRLGSAIRDGKNALANGFIAMLNGGLNAVKKGVNAIINGINWVLEKLGASKIGTWNPSSIPYYAQGTDGHPGGLAMVNDGKGAHYQEAFATPDGQVGLFPKQRDLVVPLPKGSSVLSGRKTKALMDHLGMPRYEGGIGGAFSGIWEWVSGGAKNLLDKAIGFLGIKTPESTGPSIWGSVAKGAFNMVKNAAVGFLDNKISELFSFGGPSFPGFTLTSRFGQRWGRLHEGLDYAAPMGTPIPAQSGGRVTQSRYHPTYGNFVEVTSGGVKYRYAHNSKNLVAVGDAVRAGQHLGLVGSTGRSTGPHVHFEIRVGGKAVDPLTYQGAGGGGFSAAGTGVQKWAGVAAQALRMTGQYSSGNLNRLLMQMKTESGGNAQAINNWDSNARRGTPSKGLMQVIDPTFRAYQMPGYGNIWNPLDNILASIRYSLSRYGSLTRAWRGVGYATGGLINEDGLYRLAEGGHPEFVIPTDPSRRTDAMKLLALAGKRIQGSSNKRPNELGGRGDVFGTDMTETNDLLKTLISLIAQGQNLEVDGSVLGKIAYDYVNKSMNKELARSKLMNMGS